MRYFIYYLLLALIFFSCRIDNKSNKVLKNNKEEIIGEKFVFPDTLLILNEDTIFRKITCKNFFESYTNNPIIVSIISGDCHACVDKLNKWNRKIENGAFGDDVNYIFVISLSDKNYFIRTFYKQYEFISELVIDTKDEFFIKNRFEYEPGNNTFLLDRNLKIVMQGNPLVKIDMMDIFNKKIDQLE